MKSNTLTQPCLAALLVSQLLPRPARAVSRFGLLFILCCGFSAGGQPYLLDNYDGVGDLTYITEGVWVITGGQYEAQTGGATTPEHSYASYDLSASIPGWELQNGMGNAWFGWMDLNRTIVSGWGTDNYSCGMVLAANNADFNDSSTSGYAIGFRDTLDKLVVFRFSQGIRNTAQDLPTGSSIIVDSGYTYTDADNGVNFYVELLPDGKWKVYYKKGAKLSDADAVDKSKYTDGNATSDSADTTYRGAAYKYSGWIYAHSSGASEKAFFDNFGAGQTGTPQPTTPAKGVTFSNVNPGAGSMTVSWTSGNGERRIAVVRDSPPPVPNTSWLPEDGVVYTGVNSDFSQATDQLYGGNPSGYRICYDGTGNSFLLTGLSGLAEGKIYYVMVFEYNGSGATINYLNTAVGPGNGNRGAFDLVHYGFCGPLNSDYCLTPTSVAPGVSATSISKSDALPNLGFLVGGTYPNSYPEPVAMNNAPGTSSLDPTRYFQFTVSGDSGLISITNLSLQAARGGTSTPRSFAIRSSLDNYGSNIVNTAIATVRPNWTNISLPLNFENQVSVTFRFYPFALAAVEFDNIRVTGFVIADPTTHASNVAFSDVTATSMTVSWTSGNGANRIVVVRAGAPTSWTPTDGILPSGVNADFSLAADQADGNKVCYNGSGNSFSLSGLAVNTTYYVTIFEYNGGGAYLTSGTPGAGNQTTACINPVGGADTLGAVRNTPVSVAAVKLKANDSGTGLTIPAFTDTTAQGGTVALATADGTLTYTPPPDYSGPDSFTYPLRNTYGCEVAVTVNVTVESGTSGSPNVVFTGVHNGNFVARFAGIPGYTYTVETNSVPSGPGWAKLGNVTAPTVNDPHPHGVGIFEIIDPLGDASRYYRTVWPAY